MKLLEPNIKIVTVHSSSSLRQLINSELRTLGYQDVVGVPDLQTVIQVLETGLIHWLLTPIIMEDKINVFQILRMVTEDPSMMDMRVSFIVDQAIDHHMITKAFDLGLLSYHSKMQTKSDIEQEIGDLIQACKDNPDDQSLVAASYLRRNLIEHKRFDELLRFEKSLFHLHSGHSQLFLHLVEAHLLNAQIELGTQLANRALVVAPELRKPLNDLLARFEASTEASPSIAPETPQNMLGITSCMLVEPDAAQRRLIEGLLKTLGIEQIKAFADPEPALQWLKAGNKPELVIFEWRLNQLPGPIFVQRLREFIGYGKPVTVMNKELTERDMPILREMGITDRIRKPIEPQKFLQEVVWVIHQDRAPSEPFILLQKIRQAMADSDFERLAAYTKRYMDNSKSSEIDKLMLQAELAYFRGHFTNAKNFSLQALKHGTPSVETLNLLGKSLMKLRDFEMALRCLENAEVVSPNNVRRICNMAESQLELGNNEAYTETIGRALDLDPDSQPVAEVETKAALVQGDSAKAKTLMQSLQSLLSIVSFTNNRAISLIRTNRFEDGTSLYDEAIQAVPEDKGDVRAVLHYNLGLALARMNRLNEAQHQIDAASELKSDKIQSKVISLRKRLATAISEQQPLELHASALSSKGNGEAVVHDPEKAYDELMMALKIGPGDIGCHKIYFEVPFSAQLKSLIEQPLRFKKRAVVQLKASS